MGLSIGLSIGQIQHRAATVPDAAAATTTWNPADKSASTTLSNGNLTATNDGASTGGFRSIASASSGKKYWEITAAGATVADAAVGVANASHSVDASFDGGTNSLGWYGTDGKVYLNEVDIGSYVTFASGDVLCLAFDLTAELMWFRKGAGNWNNSASANPATGAEGLDVSGLSAGPYFAYGFLKNADDAFTANFGATSYAQTAPSGFSNW